MALSCENMKSQMQITVYKWDGSNCQYLCAWRHFWNTLSLPPVVPLCFLFHIAGTVTRTCGCKAFLWSCFLIMTRKLIVYLNSDLAYWWAVNKLWYVLFCSCFESIEDWFDQWNAYMMVDSSCELSPGFLGSPGSGFCKFHQYFTRTWYLLGRANMPIKRMDKSKTLALKTEEMGLILE